MAAAKDGCGLEAAAGNGRRLHLGIPEAVFVVRDPVPWRLGPRLKITFQSPHRSALLGEGGELSGKVPGGKAGSVSPTPASWFFRPCRGMALKSGQKREWGRTAEQNPDARRLSFVLPPPPRPIIEEHKTAMVQCWRLDG